MTESDIDGFVERARYLGPTVQADQLVGLDACIRQLGGQMALLARPDLAARFGLEPSGTLFLGPPGTGKTLMARYLAGQLKVPLYQLSADEFGKDPGRIRAVFRRLAGERAILFIDEVSILAQRREHSDAEERRMLAALLTSLDGLQSSGPDDRLWVIAACTDDIELDPAIYRSRRLGVVIEFAEPSEDQRAALFRLYLTGKPHTLDEDGIASLAELANGATGADIRDWISQAASEALSGSPGEEPVIEYRHLEATAIRRGFIAATGRADHEPGWDTAVHEAGHAVIAYALFGREALARVGIAFGQSSVRPGRFFKGHFEVSDEWLANHRPNLLTWPDHVAVRMAGLCAEAELIGPWGEGARQDVESASEMILDQLDLADPEFGPGRNAIESGSDFHDSGVGAEAMRRLAWRLVRERFEAQRRKTRELVLQWRVPITVVATELLTSRRPLSGDQIAALIEGGGRRPPAALGLATPAP
jgi:ATP-dependent Zn protease